MKTKKSFGGLFRSSKKFSSNVVELNFHKAPALAKKYFNLCEQVRCANQDFEKSLSDVLGNNAMATSFGKENFGRDANLRRSHMYGESGLLEVNRLSELVIEEISELRLAIALADQQYDELTYLNPDDEQARKIAAFDDQEVKAFLGQNGALNAAHIINGYKVEEAILDAENKLQPKVKELEESKKDLAEFRGNNFKAFAYDKLKMESRNEIKKDHKNEPKISKRLQEGLDHIKAIQNGTDNKTH